MATELKDNLNSDNPDFSSLNNYKIAIVVSEWNKDITNLLKNGAIKILAKYGFDEKNIIIKYVPGSFELPLASKYLIDYANVDGVISLGCVIEGKTKHFDYVCLGVTQGIMDININTGIPVAFGVLTTKNKQQAEERAGGKYGNKGEDAALTVLKMLKIKTELMDEKK